MHIPPGFVNIVLSGTTENSPRPWATSCGFAIASFGGTDLSDLVVYMGGSDYVGNCSSSCFFTGVDLVIGTADPSEPIHLTAALEFSGGEGTPAVPSACYLIHKNTARGGRKGKGRSFLPGPTEAGVGPGGLLTGAVEDTLASCAAFWMDVPAAVDSLDGPYLLHTDPEDDQDVITSMTGDARVATQRRRLRK